MFIVCLSIFSRKLADFNHSKRCMFICAACCDGCVSFCVVFCFRFARTNYFVCEPHSKALGGQSQIKNENVLLPLLLFSLLVHSCCHPN